MQFTVTTYALVAGAALLHSATSVAAEESCNANYSPLAEATKYLRKQDTFILTYFDGRGLAEVPRTLLATAGRFPGAGFEDVRLDAKGFEAAKEDGDVAANLNRMPVLNHNGELFGQSKTIARYLARLFGLMGQNEVDAGKIDGFCEHVVDIQAAYRKAIPYKNTMTDEELVAATEMWFNTPPKPELDGRKNRQLQWYLEQLEWQLPGDGYTVMSRPSLADAYIFNLLGEVAEELGPKGEPFGNNDLMKNLLYKEFPKLRGVVEKFKISPGMEYYLKTRGKQGF